MGVSVRIPTPMRPLTNGEAEVSVEGKTVQEVIENLEKAYSGIRERLCDEEGNLRRFVNLYLNDEDIRFLQDLDTKVNDGDGLSIVPAIAGG
jgi:molybdopterin synthase sulfur carrier subunit